ncbi:MAG: hypothetical protein ACRDBY_14080 [Cetobacterium sp.]
MDNFNKEMQNILYAYQIVKSTGGKKSDLINGLKRMRSIITKELNNLNKEGE